MDLLREAFNAVFPEKPYSYTAIVGYSGKFRGYRASIRLNKAAKQIVLRMSKEWQGVNRDIQLGLVQYLLCRLFREKRRTVQMDLYAHFVKSLPGTIVKTRAHPVLMESFRRVNEAMFGGLVEQPNLVLGNGIAKLGHYDMSTDTVSISRVLLEHPRLLDYVMFHELLHKKHKFSGKGLRHTYHSRAFRNEERTYPDAAVLEKELSMLASRVRKGSWQGSF